VGIFRQTQFRCAGCDKTVRAKVTVTPERAGEPLAPPPGWFRVDVTAQHPDTGAIGSLLLFTCTEGCAKKVAKGEGPGQAQMARFKAAFAPTLTPREPGPAMGPDGPDEQTSP
jgi:hypothetical protein